MLTILMAVETDPRLGYNVYPATAETCNFFQMVATNRQKNKKQKKPGLKTSKKNHGDKKRQTIPLHHTIKNGRWWNLSGSVHDSLERM